MSSEGESDVKLSLNLRMIRNKKEKSTQELETFKMFF